MRREEGDGDIGQFMSKALTRTINGKEGPELSELESSIPRDACAVGKGSCSQEANG